MIEIIVVTYNALQSLKKCLESIEKNTTSFKYHLTVVDNNTSDGTEDFLLRYKNSKNNVKVISLDDNLGFCGGVNIALKNTKEEYIVLLDDDAVVSDNWLGKLLNEIKKSPQIGIVGCKVVFPDDIIQSAEFRLSPMQLVGQDEEDRGQRDYIKECDSVIGTCWLMRRNIMDSVGYFDETFYPCQYEDADYCLRARLKGYKIIYNGKVKIIHDSFYRVIGNAYDNYSSYFAKWSDTLHKFPLDDSHFVEKHMALGANYLYSKQFDKALEEFEEVKSFDEVFDEPFYKGEALYGMKRYEEAANEYKKCAYSSFFAEPQKYDVLSDTPHGGVGRNNGIRFLERVIYAHKSCAKMFNEYGRFQEAKEESEKALQYFSIYKNRFYDNQELFF